MIPAITSINTMHNSKPEKFSPETSRKTKFVFQTGISLIELLVAMFVGLVVILISFRILSDFFRSQRTAHRHKELQIASQTVFTDLTQDIHWLHQANLSDYGDLDQLELTELDASGNPINTTTYSVSAGRLLKNGNPLTPRETVVTRFDLKHRAPTVSGKPPLIEINLEMEHSDITGSKAVLTEKTVISMRKTRK